MTIIYNEFLELLHEFESLPNPMRSESIFDIAGYPHYENVSSNILAFYLNPNNEHALGDLLLSSLMNLVGENKANQSNIRVSREVSTRSGGRIDIVIETDSQITGVENKIYHHLNNDLCDYSDTIDSWAIKSHLDTKKIVLSIKEEKTYFDFVNVTYNSFWEEIKRNLGRYVSTSSQKWIIYLVDFMATIERLSGKSMEINENDKFFIKYEKRVNELLSARNKFIEKLNGKVREMAELLQKPDSCEKQWIYAKSCLVHDFNLSGNSIAFDLSISSQGWEFLLFDRNKNSTEYLNILFSQPSLCNHKVLLKDSRYVLKTYDLSTNLTIIKDDMLEWFSVLIQAESEKIQAESSDDKTGLAAPTSLIS